MRLPQVLAAAIAATTPVPSSHAQCAQWDEFGSVPGMNGPVTAFATFDDGSGPALYASGFFTTAVGVPAMQIARLDGARWTEVGPPGSGPGEDGRTIDAMAVFDDGSGPALYVGGNFTTRFQYLAKWDGTSWSSPGPGPEGHVHSLAVFDDGSGRALYAGGEFIRVAGQDVFRIAKWDGVAWTPLGAGLGFGQLDNASGDVLIVHDDGSGPALFVGGDFQAAGLIPVENIAKWDGSSWSALGSSGIGISYVRALASYDDGRGSKLYVSGDIFGGFPTPGLARWDGTNWLPAPGGGITGAAYAFASFDDGTGPALYVGGPMTSAGGTPVSHIARWDGVRWSALGASGSGTNKPVRALIAHDDGSGTALYAGGDFTNAGGRAAAYVASWSGARWSAVGASGAGSGMDQPVDALCVYDDGRGPALYAAGRFTTASSAAAKYVARWDGTAWSALPGGPTQRVRALAAFDDGSGPALYAGGEFYQIGQGVNARLVRWDGSSWSPVGSARVSQVKCMLVFDDGTGPALYVGGGWPGLGGFARWDGVSWSAVGGGTDGAVTSLAVHDDGSGPVLVAGGGFTVAGGTPAKGIATWDGVAWSALDASGGGPDGTVLALASFDDGSGPAIYAGGTFWSAFGLPTECIGRWGAGGWSAVGSAGGNASFWVRSLFVFDDGLGSALYAGGDFLSIDRVRARGLARWDGSTWSAMGGPNEVSGAALAFAAFDDGSDGDVDLYVGGEFRDPGVFVARWESCGVLPFCFGDGSAAPCPCANTGLTGRGCDNSVGTGGAELAASGSATADTLVLTQSGELAGSLSIYLQGSSALASPVPYGDGLRCAGGTLKRLYVKNASGGVVTAPQVGDPSVRAASAALGDPIAPGSVRVYQVYYRDPNLGFCPAPQGNSFNAGNALRVTW